MFLHADSEDSDQTRRMPESSLGAKVILLVFMRRLNLAPSGSLGNTAKMTGFFFHLGTENSGELSFWCRVYWLAFPVILFIPFLEEIYILC